MSYAKVLMLGLAMAGTLTLSGCYRDGSQTTVHEPGVYKGATDPLIAKLKSPALNRALDERAQVAFADR